MDKIHLSGKSFALFPGNDYFKVLPGDPDDYKQMEVATGAGEREDRRKLASVVLVQSMGLRALSTGNADSEGEAG